MLTDVRFIGLQWLRVGLCIVSPGIIVWLQRILYGY